MIVNLVLFKYVCGNCRHEFTATELGGDFVYGEFLLRSTATRQEAYLNAITDGVFTEIANLVKADKTVQGLSELEVGKAVQSTFSIACDKASDGSEYQIGLKPRCPKCGGEKMRYWSQVTPVQPLKKDLNHVTHINWDTVDFEQKVARVKTALKELAGRLKTT